MADLSRCGDPRCPACAGNWHPIAGESIPFELTHEGPFGVPDYMPAGQALEDGYWQPVDGGWHSWQRRPAVLLAELEDM